MRRRAVVTGLGVVTSLSGQVDDLWNRIVSGQSGIHEVRLFDTTDFKVKFGGDIYDWSPVDYISSKEIRRFDRFTQLSGNATFQKTWREDSDDESVDTVTNGNLEYRRSRLFKVPRLVFRSRLTLSQQQSVTERIVGEIIENEDNNETWENSIEYLIGRLEASVNLDFIKANESYDRIFKIQLIRSFGDL